MAEKSIFGLNSYGAKAEEDVLNATVTFKNRIGTPLACIFWCEQAIEKYFKHLLTRSVDSKTLVTQHKLLSLAHKAGFNYDNNERTILSELARMYYERYPVDEGEVVPEPPTWEDVEQAYLLVMKVRKWTHTRVSREAKNVKDKLGSMDLTGEK